MNIKNNIEDLEKFAIQIRIEALKALGNLGFGHVGGSMSIADLLAVLYGNVMRVDPENPLWDGRDYLVMSKGHSGPALYAALALRGYFDIGILSTLNQPGTSLPSHCDRNKTLGVDMSTGSLGQGISTALGLAMALKLDDKSNYVYFVLGDGECGEGQIWEGALFAPQHELNHVIGFIDWNKQQLDGYTKDILDLGDLRSKFENFGWYAIIAEGNNPKSILEAIEKAKEQKEKPSIIILDTIKGKDCSFAEGVLYNHHMTFTKEDINEALINLEQKLSAISKGGAYEL